LFVNVTEQEIKIGGKADAAGSPYREPKWCPKSSDAVQRVPPPNTMAYSQKIIDDVAKTPKSLGNQLGRWAIHLDFPVTKIAFALGVSRQTVYNWFTGTEVFVAYRNRVEFLTKIMQTSRTADEAWRKICTEYNLDP